MKKAITLIFQEGFWSFKTLSCALPATATNLKAIYSLADYSNDTSYIQPVRAIHQDFSRIRINRCIL